jgi:putative ABC transport system permease protein
MIFLKLAIKSIKNRLFTTILTVISIALSVTLLLSVERTRRVARDGFTNAISQTDLIVGARTGPLNLILYTIFNMGNATNNISWLSYQELKKNPVIDWVIPYSLGDSHKGFRVVATDQNFYDHYQFRGDHKVEFASGLPALDVWDVVIGAEVCTKLKYNLNDQVVVTHGVTKGEGIQKHDDKPFKVVGILKPTGTAIDQTVYISLYGMEAIHMDWKNGIAPTAENSTPQNKILKENIHIDQITAFFLRTKSRIQTLGLQRDINNFETEPLMAIIPGATLSELWNGLGQIEIVLQIISIMVLAIGMVAMLSSLLAGLNERRREMSILRSIGAGPLQIMMLLVFESTVLTLLGVLTGLILEVLFFFILSGWLERTFGFYFVGDILTVTEFIYLGIIVVSGVLVGLIPAIKSSRTALKDGLTIKI